MADNVQDTMPNAFDTDKPAEPAASTEQVEKPVEQARAGSSKAVHEKMRKDLEDGRAKMRDAKVGPVDTSNAKIVPSVGQARAQTSEEIRQDQEDEGSSGGVSQAAPYPGNPHDAHVKAILASERNRIGDEFRTEDITGASVDGDDKTDTVVVRLLYDWWDGQGVRHPLNSLCEMAINDARTLIEQRKAERTDPLR